MLSLVTVIYGEDPRYRAELFGSVLSALKYRRDPTTEIVVYTDREIADFGLPVTQRVISADEWQRWTRGSGVTHLVKLHLVREVLEDTGAPVIYFDTDTLFLTAPETLAAQLSPDTALMHACEGPIAAHDIWNDIVTWLGPDGREVAGVHLSGESVMFNSGVVGAVPAHAAALRRAIDIADALHAVDAVFSLDQFSTSAALGAQAQVDECATEIVHYWGWNRAFVRDRIARFRDAHAGQTLDSLCESFDPVGCANGPEIDWRDKVYARWLGWRWQLDNDSRFACLALKSAQRCAAGKRDQANRWFDVHLNFLARSNGPTQHRLAAGLSTDHQACLTWLDAANRSALTDWQRSIAGGHH